MLRYKSDKQALTISALVILLCLVCLTGATLALFTNDIKDGTIGIITTTGDVKVDIVDLTTGESLEGRALLFNTNANGDEVIFEPGATFVTQGFKIVNKGNVPINYKLHMGRNDIVDVNGELVDIEEFNRYFDIYISTDPNNPEAAVVMDPYTGRLNYVEGENTSETFFLIVKMKETAGNKFQGQEYTGVGITVYAVQGNVEIEE